MQETAEQNWTVVELPAEVTIRDAEKVRGLLRPLVQNGNFVAADASKLKFVDSTGIGLLVQYLREARAKGGDLRIRDLRGQPFKVFQQARLDWIFTIESGAESFQSKQEFFGSLDDQSNKYNLNLSYKAVGDVGIFQLSGMLCMPEGGKQLKEQLLLALAGNTRILLDLHELEYLDIKAADEILNVYFILKTSGGEIGVFGAGGLVKLILQKAGVDSLVPFFASAEAAIESWHAA